MEKTFDEWHSELLELARQHSLECLVPDKENYPHDGYDDGNTPNEELGDLYSYAAD